MSGIENRIAEYESQHCWQYDIRLRNKEEDVADSGLSAVELASLRCSDFLFQHEPKNHIFYEVKRFIERHEWLGKMSLYPTHFFTARYKGQLAGVVIMDMPAAFSKLLGEDTKKIERLISRGACVSWSPKNLASKLISFATSWMVQNTEYRLFTAYSDTEAKELGTIYQACNFYYLGQIAGAGWQYKLENGRLVSDRYFRSRSVYKKLAKVAGIFWEASWQTGDIVHFENMPSEIVHRLKEMSKDYQKSCEKRRISAKHKYAYVLGKDKRETKRLRKEFETRNKVFPYPKDRTGQLEQFEPPSENKLDDLIMKAAYTELDMFE
jgi:uncharacterized protein YktA (UPF0223 family)